MNSVICGRMSDNRITPRVRLATSSQMARWEKDRRLAPWVGAGGGPSGFIINQYHKGAGLTKHLLVTGGRARDLWPLPSPQTPLPTRPRVRERWDLGQQRE